MIRFQPVSHTVNIHHRHHIKDHTNTFCMQIINHCHKISWRTKSGRWCIDTRRIISPCILTGIFHDWHKLDVIILHALYISCDFFCKCLIGKPFSIFVGLKCLHMYLIDIHRFHADILLFPLCHICCIHPFICQLCK